MKADDDPPDDDSDGAQEYRNDGYIELVLKVMARMCDGQNHQLQVGSCLLYCLFLQLLEAKRQMLYFLSKALIYRAFCLYNRFKYANIK